MSRRLRIGIAGANAARGWAREAHLPALRALDRADIVAVSARSDAAAAEAAALFGARRAHADSLALARDPEVDVVVVTVKVPEHRAIVLAALEEGKHVYCEWPLGRDAAESRQMADAARRAGVHAAVGLQALSAPAALEAARLVREGAIGRPLNLRVVSPTAGWGTQAPAFYEYLQDRRNGATLATIPGGHTLALVEAVLGPCLSVSATNSTFVDRVAVLGSDRTVERNCADHMLIAGRHAGGCVSSVEVMGGVAGRPFVFELRGTGGELAIQGRSAGGFQVGELSLELSGAPVALPAPVRPGLEGGARNVAEAYARFLDDIEAGTRRMPGFDAALRLSVLIEAIERSSDEGRRVTLETPADTDGRHS